MNFYTTKIYSGLLTLFFLCNGLNLFAQEQIQITSRDSLTMLGKFDGQKVLLRWYHTNASGWAMGKNYGYQLDRMSMPDSLDQDLDTLLTIEEKLLPYDLNKFGDVYTKDKNKYVAIAAEIIHGKKELFSKSDTETSPFQKAEMFENLYHMAMLNAELDADAANAMALRYEDPNIEKGKSYAYRLITLDTFAQISIDTAYAIVHTNKEEPLISPTITKIYWGDKLVKIEWDRALLSNYFTAFYVERSDDGGKTFLQIHEDPYIYSNTVDADYDYIYYDSIPENDKEYFYRLRGINSFAEVSPPSEAKSIVGREKTAPTAPFNLKATYLGGTRMKITWETKKEDKDIAGFMVSKSPNKQDAFTNLTPAGLPPKEKSFIDENFNKLANNYYFVGAYDRSGNSSISLPIYGKYIDTIPPPPVTNLQATIDTNGILFLTWDPSSADDIKGYFVHFANQDDHVYAALNGIPIEENKFADTLNVKQVLTEEIFYKVVAVDYTMNYSKYSKVIKVKKPDLIPPVSALFTDYKVEEDGINLIWANSSSKDILSQELFRKSKSSAAWKSVKKFTELNGLYTSFKDTDLKGGESYTYKLTCTDDDGNLAESVDPLTVKYNGKKMLATAKIEQAKYDKNKNTIKLTWENKSSEYDHVVIYRKKNDGKFNPIKTVSSELKAFTDTKISPGNNYKYLIKTKNLKNGKTSPLSKAVEVNTRKI